MSRNARRDAPRTTDEQWRTALTCIEPNKILVRGYPLDEVMGRLTFGEAIYLLLMGEVPSPAHRPADGGDPGLVHRSRRHAAVDAGRAQHRHHRRARSRACVAAGMLGFGKYHGGDIESCMQFLDTGLEMVRKGASLSRGGRALVVQTLPRADEPPPGLRPPVPHPRSARGAAVPDGAGARGRGRSTSR